MSYAAIVTRIKTKPHPNADRLLLGDVHGHQVIVGLDTKDGDLGIFFPCDGQLSEQFAKGNDLISRVDEDGNRAGGYFGKNRRVRAQNFRGEKSEGFWCPLEYLWNAAPMDVNNVSIVDDMKNFVEGYTFTEVGNFPVCNKYITPATAAAAKGLKNVRRENRLFAKHYDTKQLRYEINNIPDGSIITVTEKLHGTSARMAYVPDPVPLKWWKKLLKHEPKTEYKHLVGSRNVILNDVDGEDHYYKDDFRNIVARFLKRHMNKGEIWYGEIVGQTTGGQDIMPSVSFDKIQDKDLRKELKRQFGDYASYRYGCAEGQFAFYVYRIAVVNEDGDLYELPWNVVKKRAKNANWPVVPELVQEFYNKDVHFAFENMVESMVGNISSTVCPGQLKEGIVVRVDTPEGDTYFLKDKTFVFKVLEGIAKEDENYVDTEESS